MSFAEQIKDLPTHQASRMIVELLARVREERLVQLTHLGEKLASDDEVLKAIRRDMLGWRAALGHEWKVGESVAPPAG